MGCVPAEGRCEVILGEEVKDFKYLGTVLFKHGGMEVKNKRGL